MITDGLNFKQDDIPFAQARSNDFVWYVTRGTAIVFPYISTKCVVTVYAHDVILSFSFGSDISFDAKLKRSKPSWPRDTLVIDNLDIRRTSTSLFQHFVIILSHTAKFHGYEYIGMYLADPRLIAVLKHIGFMSIDEDAYLLNVADEFDIKNWVDDLLSRS